MLALLLVLGWVGMGPARAEAPPPLSVVASFSVLADIAARIGGVEVAATSLIGPGSEPHEWEPTPRDVRRLAEADLVVVNGLGLEGWLDRLVTASGYAGPVVVASRDVAALHDASGAADPHAWHSLDNARLYAAAIAEGLTALRPERAADFRANLAAFSGELDALGGWAAAETAAIPPAGRVVVTTHDAFAYLGRDYGIAIYAPVGLDSAAQPSARRMAELVATIRETGVRAVFLENGGNSRLALTLAAETGVAVGGELYAGTLSRPDGPAANYIAMWRHNLELMLAAMRP